MGFKPWLTFEECLKRFGEHSVYPYMSWIDPERRVSPTGVYHRCTRCGEFLDGDGNVLELQE